MNPDTNIILNIMAQKIGQLERTNSVLQAKNMMYEQEIKRLKEEMQKFKENG